jgi:nicotinate-nucleotide adenylyltransferase
MDRHAVIVYERPGFPVDKNAPRPERVSFMQAPFLDISASYIRKTVQNDLSIKYLVPDAVAAYIEENGYYR